MKRVLLFILIIHCASLIFCHNTAQIYNILKESNVSGEYTQMPAKEVIQDSIGITVKYHFENINIQEDDLYEGTNWLKLNGFGLTYTPGTPSLPFRTDRFVLPESCESATVQITNSSFIDSNIDITPSRPLLSDSEYVPYSKSNVPPINPIGFKTDSEIISHMQITEKNGIGVMYVEISPIQYDSFSKKARIYYDFEYRIQFIFKSGYNLSDLNDNRSPENEKMEIYRDASLEDNELYDFGLVDPSSQ